MTVLLHKCCSFMYKYLQGYYGNTTQGVIASLMGLE